MNIPDLNNDTIRYQFFALNYELLAAIGWKGYLEEGRGVIFIDTTGEICFQNLLSQRWQFSTIVGFYLGENSLAFRSGLKSDWLDTETARRIHSYEPSLTTQVLVWFGGNRGDFLIQGVGSPQFPPPFCYEKLRSRLNEFII